MIPFRAIAWLALPILALALVRCSDQVAGGGTIETTNGTVVGTLLLEAGGAAARVQVKLIPDGFDPYRDTLAPVSDTTDAEGRFSFSRVRAGRYNLQSVRPQDNTGALAFGISVDSVAVAVDPISLARTGRIKVAWVDGVDSAAAYVYVPGTEFASFYGEGSGLAVLQAVPPGLIPRISQVARNGAVPTVIRQDLLLPAGETVLIANSGWKNAQRIRLDTSPSGAEIAVGIGSVPILIRLNQGNFDFSAASERGSDLRFTDMRGSPLPHEIERWDAPGRQAEIWVKVDTLSGNDGDQSIMLYSGNPAANVAAAGAVFDTAAGFQGVWHLGQAGGATALDATGNRFHGTPYGMTAGDAVPGAIGIGQRFNGVSAFIQMQGTAAGKLSFPEGGAYSLSAWVAVDSAASHPELIVGKGHSQYYLRMNYYSAKTYWEFVEYHDADKRLHISEVPAVPAYVWKHLVAVRDGARQYLYLDGKLVQDTIRLDALSQGITGRNTGYDVTLGKHLQPTTPEGDCFLKGILDEVTISSVARSAAWIRLNFMNQRTDDKLVRIGAPGAD